MIYAGVDIAKTDHVIGAVDERGAEMCRPLPFKNTEAGLERAVAWLEGLAGSPSEVVVGMEATGHYWMACYSFLVARGYSVAVINPMQVKAVRKLKGLVSVNIFFTISTNIFSPIAPPLFRRPRQRGCAASG